MTASATEQTLRVTAEDRLIARWTALAIALAVAEAGLPSPIPGIKPGLANIVTLLVLYRAGWRAAAWVSLLRVLVASMVLGGFFSPAFAMSLTGACCSLAVLAPASRLPRRWFGPVSLSLLAALAHMAGQLLLARLWLIPHNGILYLVPIFAVAALLFGVVNGVLVAWLQRRLEEES
ncbi:Gx transporter family protein [Chitinilyticum litopenaei]|uniref:Gx transporter family protein n=1 Tax=Chitinilyticum litopenaei TaxID=1121276 RepID=UPI00048B70E2|nr:Gx transporter family protein [Chitinilyticum litopenaei]